MWRSSSSQRDGGGNEEKGRKWSRLWLSSSSQRDGGGRNTLVLEVYSETSSSTDAHSSVIAAIIPHSDPVGLFPNSRGVHVLLLRVLCRCCQRSARSSTTLPPPSPPYHRGPPTSSQQRGRGQKGKFLVWEPCPRATT